MAVVELLVLVRDAGGLQAAVELEGAKVEGVFVPAAAPGGWLSARLGHQVDQVELWTT